MSSQSVDATQALLVVLGAVTCYAPWADAADRVFGPLQMTLGGALSGSGLTCRRFGIRSPMPRRRGSDR